MGGAPHDQGGGLQVGAGRGSDRALTLAPARSNAGPSPVVGEGAFPRLGKSPLQIAARYGGATPFLLSDWRLWFVAPAILALAMVVLFPTLYLFWMSVTHWVVTDPDSYFA